MTRSSATPSPPLASSPGSLSSASTSATSSSERSTTPNPVPFVLLPGPTKAPSTTSRSPTTYTSSTSPTGAPQLPRPRLATSPVPSGYVQFPSSATAPSNPNATPQPFFATNLTNTPQHSFTSFDLPATPQSSSSLRASSPASSGTASGTPTRTQRQSQKHYGGGGGLSVGTGAPGGGLPAENQLEAKVVILGSQGVGKTSIVHRYTSGHFSYSLTSTIGASFLTKRLVVDGCKVRLQLWDTAGQERFRSMAPLYYRGALAAILVYDITNLDSFHDIKTWLDELRRNMSPDLIIHVVGSKVDLAPTHRAVDLDYAQRCVAEWVHEAASPPPTPPLDSRDSPFPSPYAARPRIRAINTRTGPNAGGPGGLPSPTVIVSGREDSAPPSLSARVRKMSTKLGVPGPSLTGGSISTTSSISEGGLAPASQGDGMVRSASKLGLSLGLGMSKGRRSQEEERRTQEDLERERERERIDEMVRECGIEVSEVSGKDDYGIEDLFLDITRRLVERKAQIEHDRVLRSRDSIMIRDSDEAVNTPSSACC